MQGAGSVGIDVLMPDPDRLSPNDIIERDHIEAPALREALLGLPRPDEALATALRAQPTVLAMTVDDRESTQSTQLISVSPVRQQGDLAEAILPHARGVSEPLPILAEAARAVGVVSASLDFGSVEKLPVVTEVGGTVLSGFATELIRIELNAKSVALNASDGVLSAVSVGGLTFNVDPSGGVRPRFVGGARLTTIKAHQLLDRSADRSILQGKVVIIGVTAPGVGETFRNPLGLQEGSAAIQAEMIESVLAGDTLWRPFWAGPTERVVGLALGLAAGLLLGRVRYRLYISAIAGGSLILVGCSVWAFRRHGILLDWVFPISSLVVLCLAASAARIGVEMAARQRHEAELAAERVRRAALEREMELRTQTEALRQSLAFAVDAAQLGIWDANLRDGVWHHSPRHDAILGLTPPPPRWSPGHSAEPRRARGPSSGRAHLGRSSGVRPAATGMRNQTSGWKPWVRPHPRPILDKLRWRTEPRGRRGGGYYQAARTGVAPAAR